MARTYKLDHFTKGTGASVAPVEDASGSPQERELNRVRVPREPSKQYRVDASDADQPTSWVDGAKV